LRNKFRSIPLRYNCDRVEGLGGCGVGNGFLDPACIRDISSVNIFENDRFLAAALVGNGADIYGRRLGDWYGEPV
jgi:hypothetical protein